MEKFDMPEALTNAPPQAIMEPLTPEMLEDAMRIVEREHLTGQIVPHVVSPSALDRINKDGDSISARLKETCVMCLSVPIGFCKLETCYCDQPYKHTTKD